MKTWVRNSARIGIVAAGIAAAAAGATAAQAATPQTSAPQVVHSNPWTPPTGTYGNSEGHNWVKGNKNTVGNAGDVTDAPSNPWGDQYAGNAGGWNVVDGDGNSVGNAGDVDYD